MANRQPENQPKKYEHLFQEIDKGQIKLPMFQRDFVWDKPQTAKLIDSLLKGFPIGTFIFWKTRDELRSYRDVGNHKLPQTPAGDYSYYVLDGQQRITSLYAVKKGIRITRENEVIDYKDIYVDLEFNAEADEQIVTAGLPSEEREGKKRERRSISVYELLRRDLPDLLDTYSKEDLKLIGDYQRRLTGYDFATILIQDYPIEIACEVFERINTGGKTLTAFEIMVAKTYDEARKFDLALKYSELVEGEDEEDERSLRAAKFDTVPESVIMQCVAVVAKRQVRGREILKIKRGDFISSWEPMRNALSHAVDFVRHQFRVPVSQILPYPAILVPLTYFFHKRSNKPASKKQTQLLEQWFYWLGITERYSAASETKLGEDIERMDRIQREEPPEYPIGELVVDPKEFETWYFRAGAAWGKAILCLLAYQQPKTFKTNALVNLDNSNLKIASSKNYHHFFPKAFLAKMNKEAEPNLLANITLIDGYTNKHEIGKKAPSIYIKKFAKENDGLDDTLETHLIFDNERFGITDDDYPRFIRERSKAIVKRLNKKLQPFSA